jgi:hypothetical protein
MRHSLPLVAFSVACVGPVDAARCGDETGVMADACWMATLEDTAVQSGASAVLHCRNITDGPSRDHCLVAAATTTSSLPLPQARQVCDEVADGSWRGECHFQVLERNATTLDPRAYVEACRASAGRYAASCIDHGMCYWAVALTDPDAEHWFSSAHLDDQLRSLERAGAHSNNFRHFSQGLRWRAGRAGRIGRGAEACGGRLASQQPSHWRDGDAPRWW